ncbi:hypothetical protein [Streptomyces albipurpureus]|uniref:Secreted protein n=1 Tax=Streptomyces albipurpureus TaxID=2897419 RepID=A0ABT0UG81_9ACTN|nr:hypothetical protein [Streptomyces sp. CWNU-1]MCM2387080.1 hypothetical protein [Streptomyces sp. CWNU-1]
MAITFTIAMAPALTARSSRGGPGQASAVPRTRPVHRTHPVLDTVGEENTEPEPPRPRSHRLAAIHGIRSGEGQFSDRPGTNERRATSAVKAMNTVTADRARG